MNKAKKSAKKSPSKTGNAASAAKAVDWSALLSSKRLPGTPTKGGMAPVDLEVKDHRTEHERDFDRVVFSTPVRRLKDKTQVFPLDLHDGVRTRLTHSMEVSNLARSMGVAVANQLKSLAEVGQAERNVPAILAAIGLTHDLGNPPFGHQGEVAIRRWVEDNGAKIRSEAKGTFDSELLKDFLYFDGNAQGFRILARLQQVDHRRGLGLTAATLRAFMKYPWSARSPKVNSKKPKFGYFESEADVAEWAASEVGLGANDRHPLSYLMEACDDIAYSVLDLEDGVKKELVTMAELVAYLTAQTETKSDRRIAKLIELDVRERARLGGLGLDSKEIRDSQIELFRSYAIGMMVSDAIEFFCQKCGDGGLKTVKKGVAEEFHSSRLVAGLKDFAFDRIYKHHSVIKAELPGHSVIPDLMAVMWRAVVATDQDVPTKLDEYVYSLLSRNYVRVYKESVKANVLPRWYHQVQLVCDQVCGMTDSYAVRLHKDLVNLRVIQANV